MFVFKKIQEFRILIYCRDFLVETRLGKGYSVLYFDKSWGESIFKGQGFPILYLVWQQLQLRGYKRADCVGRTTHLPLFVFAKSTQPCLSCREPNLQPELRDRRRGVPRIERFLDFSHFNGYYIVHCSLIGLKLVTTSLEFQQHYLTIRRFPFFFKVSIFFLTDNVVFPKFVWTRIRL